MMKPKRRRKKKLKKKRQHRRIKLLLLQSTVSKKNPLSLKRAIQRNPLILRRIQLKRTWKKANTANKSCRRRDLTLQLGIVL